MKNTERAYIGIELGTHSYPEDLGQSGMDDILDEGIDISADELYEFIYYNKYDCSEEHLKMLLDDFDCSKNMFYPLYCNYYKTTSYSDWLDYKSEMGEQKRKAMVVKAPKKKTPARKSITYNELANECTKALDKLAERDGK